MQLLDDLRQEHDLIEQLLGSLRAYVAARLEGHGDPADAERYLAFFRHYAGDFHHDKEEQVLFTALAGPAELPTDRGPIPALAGEHRRMAGLLAELAPLLSSPLEAPPEREAIATLARDYSHALWRHIDAENSVLLPESEERLRRAFVRELPSRPMNALEEKAHDEALPLLVRHPPTEDPALVRGQGCVACPSYGTDCEGLEMSWWTEWEWAERWDRLQGD